MSRFSSLQFLSLTRVVLVLTAAELMMTFWQMNAALPSSALQKSVQLGGALQSAYRADERWQTVVDYQQSNANIAHHIDSFAGYDAMMSSRYSQFARRVEEFPAWNAWMFFSGDATPLLKVSATTHLLSEKQVKRISPRATFADKDGEWRLWRYENPWPRVYLSRRIERVPQSQQLARLTQIASNDFALQAQPCVVAPEFAGFVGVQPLTREDRVLDWSRTLNLMTTRTQTVAPAFLVQAEAFAPGWRAYINGREAKVENANFLFRGVTVPAGRARTVMVYEPESFRLGAFFSLCGLVALIAYGITKVTPPKPRAKSV